MTGHQVVVAFAKPRRDSHTSYVVEMMTRSTSFKLVTFALKTTAHNNYRVDFAKGSFGAAVDKGIRYRLLNGATERR
jgi:hypothetical protein